MKKKKTCKHEKEIIKALNLILQLLDPYASNHGNNVAQYAVCLAKAIRLPHTVIQNIYLAALLHDIGKIGIPLTITRKKGALTKREYNIMKKHPEYSAQVLSSFSHFKQLIPIVRHHHEQFGGGGYPDNLVGEKIPLEARIIAIADVYDAITSTRSYHHAHGRKYALDYIIKNAPQHFDPALVKVFVKLQSKHQ